MSEEKTTNGISVFESLKRMEQWRKDHPILYRLKRIKYGIANFFGYIEGTPRRILRFIHRGRYGWADCDTWGLDYYLSKVIGDSIQHLKENKHGGPANLKEGEWSEMLGKMIKSFKTAQKVSNGDLIYLPSIKSDDKKYEAVRITTDKMNKEYGGIICEVMTKEEVIESNNFPIVFSEL